MLRGAIAASAMLSLNACATGIVLIPTDSMDYSTQELVGLAVGLPADLATCVALGAILGPPGAGVGALVGVAVAAADGFIVSQLGKL